MGTILVQWIQLKCDCGRKYAHEREWASHYEINSPAPLTKDKTEKVNYLTPRIKLPRDHKVAFNKFHRTELKFTGERTILQLEGKMPLRGVGRNICWNSKKIMETIDSQCWPDLKNAKIFLKKLNSPWSAKVVWHCLSWECRSCCVLLIIPFMFYEGSPNIWLAAASEVSDIDVENETRNEW